MGTVGYLVLSVLQPLSASVFCALSIGTAQHIALAVVVVVLSWLWLASSTATGFRKVEKAVLRSQGEIPDEVAAKYVNWNVPVHVFNGVVLVIAFGVLLTMPFA